MLIKIIIRVLQNCVGHLHSKWTLTSRLVGYSLPTSGCAWGLLLRDLKTHNITTKIASECLLRIYFTRMVHRKSNYAVLDNLKYICKNKTMNYTYDTVSTWCDIAGSTHNLTTYNITFLPFLFLFSLLGLTWINPQTTFAQTANVLRTRQSPASENSNPPVWLANPPSIYLI